MLANGHPGVLFDERYFPTGMADFIIMHIDLRQMQFAHGWLRLKSYGDAVSAAMISCNIFVVISMDENVIAIQNNHVGEACLADLRLTSGRILCLSYPITVYSGYAASTTFSFSFQERPGKDTGCGIR